MFSTRLAALAAATAGLFALHACSARAPGAGAQTTRTDGLTATSSSAPGRYHLADNQSGLSVEAALRGVTQVAAEAQPDGSVVFRKAYGGADLVERTLPEGVEDYLSFPAAPAAEQTDYDVQLGPTVAGLRLVENVLEFLDAGGVPRIRIPPPFIQGADGVTSSATLSVEGCAYDTDAAAPFGRPPVAPGAAACVLHVSWSGSGVVYPAILDPGWTWTGLMVQARTGHLAFALPNGRVLVAGGEIAYRILGRTLFVGATRSAEIYDPVLRKWTPTGSMVAPRAMTAGAALPDGRILVAGGAVRPPGGGAPTLVLGAAELYDPATGRWRLADPLATPRYQHAAVATPDGVLVCGGTDGTAVLDGCERYAAGWTPGPRMTSPRAELTLTAAAGAKVLAAGGRGASGALRSAEVLDGGAWTAAAPLAAARSGHTAAALPDGSVLVAGGAGPEPLASAERYDLARDRWTARADALPAGVSRAAAAVANGVALVAGGAGAGGATALTALFDPVGESFLRGPALQDARAGHTLTPLGGSLVLAAGGTGAAGDPLATSELLQVRKGNGAACGVADECQSGFCAEGVCCGSACGDTCGACDLPGTVGVCTPTAAPRHGACAGSGPCAGSCAGELGCTYPSADRVCADASCADGRATAAARCDGRGACDAPAVTACGAYACGAAECRSSCAVRADCASTRFYCLGAQCVVDAAAPVLALPDLVAAAASAGGAAVSFAASATDAVDGPIPATCVPASGATFPLGSTPVACSAADLAGNVASATFGVLVRDTTPPALLAPAAVSAEATGAAGAAVAFGATATDAVDGDVAVGCTPAPGTVFPLGETTVTCSAVDRAGNVAGATLTVKVADTTAPALSLPGDVEAEATAASGAAVPFDATAFDAVDGARPVACDHPAGWVFPLGTTPVTCTAADLAGNVAAGTFRVTVSDTTAPALTVPASITAQAADAAGARVAYEPAPSAADLVDGDVAVACSPASGSQFPLGETVTVRCTAADSRGNATARTFPVTVVDNVAPRLTVPANLTVEAAGPAGAAVTFQAAAVDDVSGPAEVTCKRDGEVLAAGAAGFSSAVPYRLDETAMVTCSATDARGNTATGGFTIAVVDTTPPAVAVPAGVRAEAAGSAGAAVSFAVSATDAVDGPVAASCLPAPGSVFPLGDTTVTCTAADVHRNSAARSFVVTVADATAPVLTVPADLRVEATGPAGAAITYAASASDLVAGSVAVSCSPAPGATFPLGRTAVACAATDASGNAASAGFAVEVVDTTPPALALPGNLTAAATDSTGAVVTFAATASDLVDGATAVGCTPASGARFPVGVTTVSCSATDSSGNRSAGSFQVSVTAPAPSRSVIVRILATSGRVTGGGIDCLNGGGTCSTTAAGPLTLTAQPDPGFSVKSWSGCTPSADLLTCTVPSGTTSTVVSMSFQAGGSSTTPYSLIVRMLSTSGTVTGGGLSCTDNAGTCSAQVTGPVTLTAQPAAGYSVKSWSGCTPSADQLTCNVAGGANVAVNVTFQSGPPTGTPYTLIVRMLSASGSVTGGGIACTNNGGTCSATMTGPVTLSAQPASGYSVASWSGCTPSADLLTCTVPGTANSAVNITFQSGPPVGTPYTLIVRMLSNSGTVTGGGIACTDNGGTCSATMTAPVTLTAAPAAGYSVKSWSGCTPSPDLATCSVPYGANIAVNVTFQSGPPAGAPRSLIVRMLSLAGAVTGGGIDCTNNTGTCSASITGPVTLLAQPASGYSVASWSGCTPSADLLACAVDGSADAAVSISFQAGPPPSSPYTLIVRMLAASGTVTGGGISCTDNGGTCSAPLGGPVTLTAQPSPGFTVKSWSGCTPSPDLSTCDVASGASVAVNITFQ